MKGMEFDPVAKTLKFIDGSREVISNAGKMVNFLPSTYDYNATISVVFPDFSKDYMYHWTWINDYNLGKVAQDNACATSQTIVPQEWSDTTVLASVPSGADIFLPKIRISRTSSPSHTWGGSPINVLPPSGVWIPFSGSMLVEAELGMVRAFSLYISGGNLILHRQQSVSTGPGGWGAYGTGFWVYTSPADGYGGELTYGSQAGIPVANIDVKNTDASVYNVGFLNPPAKYTHKEGQSDACSVSLSTNFSSTYQVEIVGKFGRRS